MTKIKKYDLILILLFSLSILFWDLKSNLSNLRFSIIFIPLFYFLFFKKDIFVKIKKINDNWKYTYLPFLIVLFHYIFISLYIDSQFSYSSLIKLIFLLILFIICQF